MICMNCQKDLVYCTCPDLAEKIAKLEACTHLLIGRAYLERIKAHLAESQTIPPEEGGQTAFSA